MPITIDLNRQASRVASQPTNTPEALKQAVLNNFAVAVNNLAKKSSLIYSLDAPTLERVLARYLEQNPSHNNPFNIVLTESKQQAEAKFYDLSYHFEGMPKKPTWFNKHPEQPVVQKQGVFEYIAELRRSELVDGKVTHLYGKVEEGKRQYIPELKGMSLVDGKATFPDGTVYEGKWQYIPELKGMRLVDGKATFLDDSVYEGKWQYILELKGMSLVDGKVTFPDDTVYEGKRQYIPELKEVYLVDGKAIFSDDLVREGKLQYIPELKGMCLVDGKVIFPDGTVYEGKWQYIPASKRMELVSGKIALPDGKVLEGRFAYIPELGGMSLVEGKKTLLHGRVDVGCWVYNAAMGSMCFVSDMAEQLQGWLSEGDASENRAEAVQRMERAYGSYDNVLSLAGLNLKALPHQIGQLTTLAGLDLSDNALSALPSSLAELPVLETLVLCNNPLLAELPLELFSGRSCLLDLDLSDCQSLMSLPAGFERLPARAIVNLEGTGLSVNVLEAVARAVELARVQSGGLLGPQVQFSLPAHATRAVMSLGAEMLEWFKEVLPDVGESPSALDQGVLRDLSPEAAEAFATLLMRLRKTGQYAFASQVMASRVVALLTGLIEQPSLLETFCAMAVESNETCDDRTALGMLNMELALLEHQAMNKAMHSTLPKQDTFKQLFDVGKGVFRQRALMEIAHEHAQRASGYVDETEIVLKYITHLGADLELPVQWGHMLYERFAFQVTDEDLARARAQLVNAASLDKPEFLSFMCKWHPFQAVFKQLEPEVNAQLERDLGIIQRSAETKQERLFEEYEQVCSGQGPQEGPDSERALNLAAAMNQNSARIQRHADAIWRNAMLRCLGQTEGPAQAVNASFLPR